MKYSSLVTDLHATGNEDHLPGWETGLFHLLTMNCDGNCTNIQVQGGFV